MSEEDIKDAAVDAAEEEKSEYDKLADFVDLEDLSSLMGEDDFADLDDLGDISDLDLNGDEEDISADMTEKLPEQQPLVKDEVPEQSNQAETVEKAQVTEESEASLDDLVGDFLNESGWLQEVWRSLRVMISRRTVKRMRPLCRTAFRMIWNQCWHSTPTTLRRMMEPEIPERSIFHRLWRMRCRLPGQYRTRREPGRDAE